MDLVALKVVLEHQSEKLTLPTGIPSTVEKLSSIVKETFGLVEEFTLHYLDEDFGDYFTLHSTNDIKNKGTIKVVIIPSVVLSFTALTENDPSSSTDTRPDIQTNHSSAIDTRPDIQTDGISVSPQDSAILSPLGSVSRSIWPAKIIIPHFSMAAEEALKNANEKFVKDGTLLTTTRVRSEILEKLADYMYSYTAYPTGRQISEVAEALVKIHPCLAEPGSHTGWNGWMYSLKYKMGNYRTKLRSLGFPEVTCNSFKNKRPDDRTPAKNVKKARKGEVVFLPCYPAGIAKDQQEVDRNQLIEESKKRDSTAFKDLMCRTFAHRRHDVISLQMSIKDIKDRWPTLFNVSQVSVEFQRITTINLEPKFMSMLDLYFPKLLTLFQVKKGGLGERLRAQLTILHQSGISIHRKREVVIRCLIDYLGEDACGLIKEFEDSADHTIIVEEELADEAIKIYILQSNGAVTDVGVVIEGITVLKNLANLSRACCYLLGLTYSLDLRYPKTHRYSFEVFQKLLLELDPAKLSVKVQRLKKQLLG